MATENDPVRHEVRDYVIRLLRYVVLTLSIPAVIGTILILSEAHYLTHKMTSRHDFIKDDLLTVLFLSPIIESVIMIAAWRLFQTNRLRSTSPYLYCITMTTLAFVTHGFNVTAILPSTMFAVSSFYYSRSKIIYRSSTAAAFAGILAIHVLYNVPSTVIG